jgi:4a-hydroxytetrahydrobiopterin dehydratase
MNLTDKHCTPIEKGASPLTGPEEDLYFKKLVEWRLVREGTHHLVKEIKFAAYIDGAVFVEKLAALADAEQHHPDIHLYYKRVAVELYTHAVGGLSINDFILASKIDELTH